MSSWIKENKASIIAGGIGIVLVAGIAAVGISKNSEAEALQQEIRTAESTIQGLSQDTMPPTQDVLKQTSEILKDYQESMASIEAQYVPFHKNCVLENIGAQAFQNDLKKMVADWRGVCTSKGVVITPEAQNMGFNAYVASAPSSTAAPLLNFERLGINYFLTKLADSGATKVLRVYRTPLGIEATADPKSKTPGQDAPSRGRGAKKGAALWEPLSFEVAFTGDRQSVGAFLNEITTNDQYLFTISALRVKNELQTPPTYEKPKTGTSVAAAPVPSSPGITLAGGSASSVVKQDAKPKKASEGSEEDDMPKSREILQQVLGNEKVNVHLVVSLIYFPEQPVAAGKNK